MGRIPAAYYPYLHSIYISSSWDANPTLTHAALHCFFYEMKEGKEEKKSEKQGGVYMHVYTFADGLSWNVNVQCFQCRNLWEITEWEN